MKIVKMNNYILCYRSEKGNRPCKTLLGEYITGTDVEDININSTGYWKYYKSTYGGEDNIVICKNKNLELILESKK